GGREHPRVIGRHTRGPRRLGLATVLASVWLPLAVAAAPPSSEPDSRFSELPSPDGLPAEVEPSERSSPPEKSAPEPKEDEPEEDESAVEIEDEDEDEKDEKPKSSKPTIKKLSKAKWIKHEVIPGERLDDIATRYDVHTASLIRWNK